MKLHIEGRISKYIEAAFSLSDEEKAEYRALTTDEERESWLGDLAREMAWDADEYESQLDEIEWRLSDAE